MSDHLHSEIVRAVPRPNECTLIQGPSEPWVDARDLRASYARARALLGADTVASEPGYRLYWMHRAQVGQVHLGVGPEDFVVVGRHGQADVTLGSDSRISLRHLLCRVVTTGGELALDVRDLRARQPFYLTHDTPLRSIVAVGPVALRLGKYVLVGLPTGPNRRPLPTELPEPELLAKVTLSPADAPSERAPDERTSVITRAPVNTLVELGARPDEAVGRLRVRRGALRAAVWLGERHLARGVLLGRYPRCVDGGVREVLDARVSRAHLLVTREGPDAVAYDLCSTNGTRLGRERVRRVVLRDERDELQLAGHHGVAVAWHPGR